MEVLVKEFEKRCRAALITARAKNIKPGVCLRLLPVVVCFSLFSCLNDETLQLRCTIH